MSYEQIIYEPGKVARVILNRPEYRNAQSRVLLEEVDDAFDKAAADGEVRVIVLSGNGQAFSSGNDTGSPAELADRERRGYPTPEDRRGQYERGRVSGLDRVLRLRGIPKPTIAMVHGYCIVAGWTLASSMDIIFAAEDAMFLPGQPQHGSLYDGPVSARKAKEVLFEGRFIGAQEALQMGIINRVYAAADLERETLAYAEKVAEKDAWALEMLKYSVDQALDEMGYATRLAWAHHTLILSRDAAGPPMRGRRLGGSEEARPDKPAPAP